MPAGFVHLHVHSQFSFMDGAAPLAGARRRVRPNSRCPRSRSPTTRGCRERSASTRRARRPASRRSSAARSWSRPPASWASEADLPPEKRLVLPASVGFGRASASGHHLTLLCRDFDRLPQPVSAALADAPARACTSPASCRCATSRRTPRGSSRCRDAPTARRPRRCSPRAPGRAREALAASVGMLRARRLLRRARAPADRRRPAAGGRARRRSPTSSACRSSPPTTCTTCGPTTTGSTTCSRRPARAWRCRDPTTGPTPSCGSSLPRRCAPVRGAAARVRRHARDRGEVRLELPLGRVPLPGADIPRGETPYSVLAKESWRGLERRYQPMTPEAISRLQHELSLIDSMGFSEYFLVVKEIVDFAKSRGHPLLGPRERGRQHRDLRAGHHRRRPGRATTCSSSGSSTPSAARCPTSTWTSTPRAETRSSTSSTSGSAPSTSRWSPP